MINRIQSGIEQVNLAYIEKSFNREDYLIMLCVYLVTFLLVELGIVGKLGLYQNYREVGYWGWLTVDNKTLFFAPTKSVLLDTTECVSGEGGTLSLPE
jgi:hypothetical protein